MKPRTIFALACLAIALACTFELGRVYERAQRVTFQP